MKRVAILLAFVMSLIVPRIAIAAELKPETRKAWENYIEAAKTRLEKRITGRQAPFLWIDEDPERARRVRAGTIAVAPAEKDNPREVPHGLIHDWIGGVFVPNTTLDAVLRVLTSYDRYQEYYKPRIARSQLLPDNGNEQKFALLLTQKEFGVTAVFETDNQARVMRIDDNHAYTYSSTTRVQAIAHFREPTERKYAVDTGPGYVWRLVMCSRLEQRSGGVYLESETMALSRAIPNEFRWLVEPLTERVPRATVVWTLQATRDAVAQAMKSSQAW